MLVQIQLSYTVSFLFSSNKGAYVKNSISELIIADFSGVYKVSKFWNNYLSVASFLKRFSDDYSLPYLLFADF